MDITQDLVGDKLISAKDVMGMLGVDRPRLQYLENSGRVKVIKVGNVLVYLLSHIIASQESQVDSLKTRAAALAERMKAYNALAPDEKTAEVKKNRAATMAERMKAYEAKLGAN